MSALVSIVVVTCGKNNYHISCLESIARQTYRFIEVILIDNSFNSSVPSQAKAVYPAVKVLISAKNLYYCDSMNQGIAHCQGEFVLCLNDDVTLHPEFIHEAMKGFQHHERVGMVSGKILRQDGKTIDSTGLFLSPFRTAKERGYGVLDKSQYEKDGRIFGVCGAAAFYRRKMLDEISLNGVWFDPTFHIFYEDLDVSWRAHRRGWLGYYVHRAVCFHVRGGSVREGKSGGKFFARRHLSDARQVDLFKNRYLTMRRNETMLSFVTFLVPILVFEVFSWGNLLLTRPFVLIKIFAGLRRALQSPRLSSPFPGEAA